MKKDQSKQEDAQLINTAKTDPAQFYRLYNKYQNKVYSYFWYRLGHDKDTAEDLAQETFIRAFNKLASYENRGYSYLTYLLRIAHNLLVNHYREHESEELDEASQVPVEIRESLEDAVDAEALWLDVQKLPLLEQEVILLFYRRELSIKKIAIIIGKSENAVKLILSRARKRLRRYYNDLTEMAKLPDKKAPAGTDTTSLFSADKL